MKDETSVPPGRLAVPVARKKRGRAVLGRDYVIENGKAQMTVEGGGKFVLGEIDMPKEPSDGTAWKGWVGLVAAFAAACLGTYAQVQFQEKLDDCVRTHHGWAAKYYNSSAPHKEKEEVLIDCGFDLGDYSPEPPELGYR